MEADKVQSSDDILAAADARLNAPDKPTIEPAAIRASREEPAPEPEVQSDLSGEGEAAGPEAGEEPSYELDGETLTPAQIRQMRTNAQRVEEADRARAAAEYLLQNPEEYERVRRQRGLAREEPAPAPAADRGPDPVQDPRGWKYERFNQYVDYLTSRGQTATPAAITAQVEQDLVNARTERMHEIILEERASRDQERQQTERARAEWRQDQEAAQIGRQLAPLFEKFPAAATAAGQEEVEARIIRAVHLGERVDYEKIVRTVAERSSAAVKEWAGKKRAMGAATGPASGRGGSAQGTRSKLVDRLPADVSSISEYAERSSRGET